MTDGPGELVPKDAFVMPEIPAELGIDPALAGLLHCLAFLELSGDDAVNPDWAVEALKHVSAYLQRLSEVQRAHLANQLAKLSHHAQREGFDPEFSEWLDDFMENMGLEEGDEEAEGEEP